VALRLLLDLWKAVSIFASEMGLAMMTPAPGVSPSPQQLYGIEINAYAHELAQTTVWIGYLQWQHENGYRVELSPVLLPLNTIRQMDAILAYDEAGKPVEPAWPAAEVIVGNPPFLGDKKMAGELGIRYVSDLRKLYAGRVRGGADLVAFWFERARYAIEKNKVRRVGLLATQSIRKGANQAVLRRIKDTGDIFFGESDRPWVLDGAAVRVSMVGFDDGSEKARCLDGKQTAQINADLTTDVDITSAQRLDENQNLGFIGNQKSGPFDVSESEAEFLIGRASTEGIVNNRDVIKPWLNGSDITGRPKNKWIIDFGFDTPIDDAKKYRSVFALLESRIKHTSGKWWLHARPRPAMWSALRGLSRYVVTPRVAKHRVFVWASIETIPDSRTVVIASASDYMFGILHSRVHEVWSLATSSRHGVGNDPTYNAQSCFETFPFPWPPGQEPQDDARVQAIAAAAQDLVAQRDGWLNPPGLSEAELKSRTLTNLYNQRPAWLAAAHARLDAAVFAAYGWPDDLSDEELLARLLALNLWRG
jgi:hypothetical protein